MEKKQKKFNINNKYYKPFRERSSSSRVNREEVSWVVNKRESDDDDRFGISKRSKFSFFCEI